MEPYRNEPTEAKDEVVENFDSTDTTHGASATTAPTPYAVPSSNPAPGPLPSTWATGTPTFPATTTSHDQATKSNKKAPKARPSREPVFSKHPPKGLGREDREDYVETYNKREAVNDRNFKHPRSGPSQRSRHAGELGYLIRRVGKKSIKGVPRKSAAQGYKDECAEARRLKKAKESKMKESKKAVIEEEDEDVEMEEEGNVDEADDLFVQPADHRPGPPQGGKDDDDEPGMGGGKGGLMGAGQAVMV